MLAHIETNKKRNGKMFILMTLIQPARDKSSAPS